MTRPVLNITRTAAADAAGLCGVACIIGGVAHWSPAAALVVAGLFLLTFAVLAGGRE